jgi:hypothetical protein
MSNDAMREALAELVKAVDDVGVKFLDTYTVHPLVDRLQSATLVARAALAQSESQLPPLPPSSKHSIGYGGFEMLTYGEACYRKAIEYAARRVESYCGAWQDDGAALAAELRALIGEKT